MKHPSLSTAMRSMLVAGATLLAASAVPARSIPAIDDCEADSSISFYPCECEGSGCAPEAYVVADTGEECTPCSFQVNMYLTCPTGYCNSQESHEVTELSCNTREVHTLYCPAEPFAAAVVVRLKCFACK